MEILNQFGVQPVLLAAQVVNFLILLFILNKLLYKPILRVLDERKKRIEDSLKNAEEIEKRLNEISEREAEMVLRSAKEGEKIIKEATDYAAQLIEDSRKEYERLINKGMIDARRVGQMEKDMIMQQAKSGLGEIISLALEKVTGKILSQKDQGQIIEKTIKEFKT
ncbi:hypothetical protein HY384_02430 [Candidatus Daviesbacteria bacterium]|nr:hypothetical protein [Candidatus Daviesbacteria bacterium]